MCARQPSVTAVNQSNPIALLHRGKKVKMETHTQTHEHTVTHTHTQHTGAKDIAACLGLDSMLLYASAFII